MSSFLSVCWCFLLSLPLIGQTFSGAWQSVPAHDGAPAFRCRIAETPEGFRFQVSLPRPLEPREWALQLWVADEAMVRRRRRTIAEIQGRIREVEALRADPDHAGEACQESIQRFLDRAEGALQRVRNYDPFRQSVWHFNGGSTETSVLPQHPLLPEVFQDGEARFSGMFKFERNLDVADTAISRVAWKLALVPGQPPVPLPTFDPWRLRLAKPWDVRRHLTPEHTLLLRMRGKPEQGAFLPSKDGYLLATRGEVGGAGCYGVEGVYLCPDIWKCLSSPQLLSGSGIPPGIEVVSHGPTLAIRRGVSRWTIAKLRPNLSSEIEEGWEILDLQRNVRGDVFLLAQGTGLTRPYGGSSNCGAGTSVDVVWIHLGRDGRVLDCQAINVVACDSPTGVQYSYDRARPAKGLNIVEPDPA